MKVQHYPAFLLVAFFFSPPLGKAKSRTIILDFDITPPAGKLSVTEIPKKPRSFVIDEPAQFSAAEKSELENSLSGEHTVPTYIVIKKGKLPVPVNLYCNELLRRWTASTARFSAMILSIDTPLPETFVIISGRNIDADTRDDLLKLGNAALKLIDNEPGQFEDIRRIASALSPALNTFTELYRKSGDQPPPAAAEGNLSPAVSADARASPGQAFPHSHSHSQKTTSQWDLLSAKLDWHLIRILFILVCAILSIAVAIIISLRIRRHRPLYFPVHKPRHRFSAPYSGGSNAQIKYVSE